MASNGRPKLSEKGLLTPDNCASRSSTCSRRCCSASTNFDRQSIINKNVAIAKAARVFDVPVVLTTVETKAFSGHMWPQVQAVFPSRSRSNARTMNSWDDEKFVAAVKKTGRKKLLLAGLWTET